MKKTKKTVLILLSLTLLMAMTACGTKEPAKEKKASPKKEVKQEKAVLSKDNMGSTDGLTLAEGSDYAYYTDRAPDSAASDTITVSEGPAAGTNINIMSDSSTSGKLLSYFTDTIVEKLIRSELDKFNSTSPDMKMEMSNFSLKEETLRGIKVKHSTYTLTVSDPTSGITVSMTGEQVYAPLESSIAIITLTSVNNATDLNQTFQHICNTIYGN